MSIIEHEDVRCLSIGGGGGGCSNKISRCNLIKQIGTICTVRKRRKKKYEKTKEK
jgi:hypothetical protein